MLGFWKATNILKDIILGEDGVIRDKKILIKSILLI